jgi:hypothetical protein
MFMDSGPTKQSKNELMDVDTGRASTKRLISPRLKKLAVGTAVVFALVLVGGAIWYLIFKKDPQPSLTGATTPATTDHSYISDSQNKERKPFAVIYSFRNNSSDPLELFWRPIGGGDPVSALKLTADSYLSQFATKGPYVVAVSTDQSGPKVWLSNDSGKSYSKVMSGENQGDAGRNPQITSAIFSNDQKRLLVALLGTNSKNTVTEISTASKEAKVLFTSDSPGVFFDFYDSAKAKLYYSTGCYNCDGNTGFPYLLRDLATGQEKVLINTSEKYRLQTNVSPDKPEIVYIQGSRSVDSMGDAGPYQLLKLNTETGQITPVKESQTPEPLISGLGLKEQTYYVKGSGVYSIENDGLLFDAELPINQVYTVTKDLIVLSSGSLEKFQVVTYDTTTKKASVLMTGTANTAILGITEQ